MDTVRILHTADLHLNNGFTAANFPYMIVKERQKDLLEAFDKIIKICCQKKVNLLFFSGDLFEYKFVDLNTIEYVNNQFSKLSNTYVFILPGNHDPFYMLDYYRNFLWSKNVFIFNNQYKKVEIEELNVVIHGIGFGYQEEKRPILKSLVCEPSKKINILLLHGSDMTIAPKKESNYLPFEQLDLINSGFDYIALGHYHQYKEIKNLYGKIIAAYPGSPEPLGFDEEGRHGIILANINKKQNDISLLPISKRQYFKLDIDISNCEDFQQIKKNIKKIISNKYPEKNLFSIKLIGNYSWKLGESLELLYDQCRDLAYYIEFQDNTEEMYDLDTLIAENTLLSSYILEIQDKLKKEKDIKKRNILKKALKIGIDALKGGGYTT
ncbi:metallophosphoesterase family protein [Garciella nitratireducens]|uniref:DNA repair exonuclease SbcCD nuclease subunit n=1 Tax=Garciella nitratireducens DSM 15102 TaxID=1121911 RepID=A0A1T4K835_9FIRM|nr:DNA repair exonuclease [Garciella nitratireducens]SJZ38604.1 DNA repair exonuclease SbcCD nuclease subunit [Garciella nitratireducens DSM 15102]